GRDSGADFGRLRRAGPCDPAGAVPGADATHPGRTLRSDRRRRASRQSRAPGSFQHLGRSLHPRRRFAVLLTSAFVVQTSAMTINFYDAAQVDELLDYPGCIDAMRRAMIALSTGERPQPLRQIFTVGNNQMFG